LGGEKKKAPRRWCLYSSPCRDVGHKSLLGRLWRGNMKGKIEEEEKKDNSPIS